MALCLVSIERISLILAECSLTGLKKKSIFKVRIHCGDSGNSYVHSIRLLSGYGFHHLYDNLEVFDSNLFGFGVIRTHLLLSCIQWYSFSERISNVGRSALSISILGKQHGVEMDSNFM